MHHHRAPVCRQNRHNPSAVVKVQQAHEGDQMWKKDEVEMGIARESKYGAAMRRKALRIRGSSAERRVGGLLLC